MKFHGTMNDPLPVLPGNEQDLGYENIVKRLLVLPSVQGAWHCLF